MRKMANKVKPFIGTYWFSCVVGCPNCNDGDCAMWDIPLNDDKVRCSTCGYKMTKEEFKRREKEALAKKIAATAPATAPARENGIK